MSLPCVLKSYLNGPRLDHYLSLVMDSLILAVVLAPLLLYLYRRRVVQLMGGVVQTGASASALVQRTLPNELESARVALVPTDGLTNVTQSLETAARQRARQLTRTLMKSVMVFAVTVVAGSVTLQWKPGVPFWKSAVTISEMFLIVLAMSWPIVLLGTANPRFVRWFLFVVIPSFLAIEVSGGFVHTGVLSSNQRDTAIFILLMCIGVSRRHMRNVVPTLTLAMCIVLFPLAEADLILGGLSACLGPMMGMSDASKTRVGIILVIILVVLIVSALIVGLWGANRILGALASAYRRKRFSDAQLKMFLWFAVITVPLLISGLFRPSVGPNTPPVLVLVLAGISILLPAVVYGLLVHRLPSHRPPVTLLLLRVFGQSREKARVLDRLTYYWRFIGPIWMIGGPDLARAYVEPHKIAAFLSRRLSGGFISDAASLARWMREIDLEPDPDTRYRVQEFFCAGEIWVAAVRYLMQRCDVVLVDLGEFHAGRQGTATELEMLSHLGALGKTIVIVGKTTDMDAMRDAFGRLGTANKTPPLHVVKDVDTFEAYEFFKKVVQVAKRPVQAGHDVAPPSR